MKQEQSKIEEGNRPLFSSKLNRRPDVRAGNGGIYGGQRTVRNDKTISFDSHIYFSYELMYYLRQIVWVEYDGDNWICRINVYDNNGVYRNKICTIDDSNNGTILNNKA